MCHSAWQQTCSLRLLNWNCTCKIKQREAWMHRVQQRDPRLPAAGPPGRRRRRVLFLLPQWGLPQALQKGLLRGPRHTWGPTTHASTFYCTGGCLCKCENQAIVQLHPRTIERVRQCCSLKSLSGRWFVEFKCNKKTTLLSLICTSVMNHS